MKIQLAMDTPSIKQALRLGRMVQDHVDFMEVGTPLIKTEGAKAIRAVRACFPGKTVVADMKTIDGGEYETQLAFEEGADITVVMGCAEDVTIESVMKVASKRRKEVMIDLLGVRDLPGRIRTLSSVPGKKTLLIHMAVDRYRRDKTNPINSIAIVRRLTDLPLAVAGGVSLDTVEKLKDFRPSVIVVGSAIASAKDPVAVAREFKRLVTET